MRTSLGGGCHLPPVKRTRQSAWSCLGIPGAFLPPSPHCRGEQQSPGCLRVLTHRPDPSCAQYGTSETETAHRHSAGVVPGDDMGDTSSGAAGKTLFSGSQQPCWPLVKNPVWGGPCPTVWPRAAGALSRDTGIAEEGVTVSGKLGTCCWLACPPRGDAWAGEAAPGPQGGCPRPQPSLPTILSRSRPLAWPRSLRREVSRSPHSGFLHEGKRWGCGLGVTRPTCPPSQAPYPPSSDLHLRIRSKSTLLWGEIFPLTA